MGKGDQRSRRGKIWRGTFGKRRPKSSKRIAPATAASPVDETKPAKKEPAKKEAAAGEQG